MVKRSLKLLTLLSATLLLLLVLFSGGLFLYLKNMDFNTYKPLLKQMVMEATGRNMEIDGGVELNLSLHPFLTIDGLHLANADNGSRANMVNVERMEVQLSLKPLLDGELEVDKIVLVGPDILLETLPSGAENWIFETGEQGGTRDAAPLVQGSDEGLLLPQVRRILIRDAQMTYRDRAAGNDVTVKLKKLEMWQAEGERRISLQGMGALDQRSLEVKGSIDNLQALLANEQIQLQQFDLHYAGLHGRFDGSVALPLDGEGLTLNADLKTKKASALANLFGLKLLQDLPARLQVTIKDTSTGYIFSQIKTRLADSRISGQLELDSSVDLMTISGEISADLQSSEISLLSDIFELELAQKFPVQLRLRMKGSGKQIHFSEIRAKLADSDLAGQLELDLSGKRPVISGELKADYVDLPRFLPKAAIESKEAAPKQDALSGARLFSDEVIDYSLLSIADINMALKVKRLLLSDRELIDLNTQINLHHGSLKLAPLALGIAGGKVSGSVSFASTHAVSLQFYLSDIDPSALLLVEKGQQALIKGAPINADITLNGKGKSLAEIMAHADGLLLLELGEGRIQSQALRLIGGDLLMNLANTVNPFAKKMNYNELKCGVVHFRIQDGEMRSRNGIAFETDHMNIISSGTVNLANEEIDLSINTETREGLGLNVTNMVNVVKLGGTLAEPGMAVDAVKTGMVAARTAGAIVSGGLSLLGETLLNRVMADSKPCETAMKMEY